MRTIKRYRLTALFLVLGGCGASTPEANEPTAQPAIPVEAADVYTGPDGLELRVLALAPRSDGKLLIQFNGSGTEFDGKVLAYERERRSDTRVAYTTKVHGRSWYPFQEERRAETTYEVYLPGHRGAIPVRRDAGKSKILQVQMAEIVALHQKQKADGTIENFARFDRKSEEAAQEKELADEIAAMQKACGAQVAGRVDWSTVTDAFMLEKSVSGWCDGFFDGARQLCERAESARAAIGKQKELVCRFGEGGGKIDAGDGKVTFTVPESNVDEAARNALRGAFVEEVGGKKMTLGERMQMDQTSLCTDGKSHYVAVFEGAKAGRRLAYGDGKRFVRIAQPGGRVPDEMFLDPRHNNPTLNSNFWGIDLRPYSSISVEKDGSCKVMCGQREIKLGAVPAADKKGLLVAAGIEDPVKRRIPHALARDSRGIYYLVDKADEEGAKDYRLYVGPKGNLKPQKMTNVVSDSEGEVFSTKTGSLRFVLGKAEASWIAGAKNTKLLLVPVMENLPMIYNDLGVFTGRMGTPCDDL